MRITYRTLGILIAMMNDDQKDSDVTVEIPSDQGSECFASELRLAGEDHNGGLDDGHPIIYAHCCNDEPQIRLNDAIVVANGTIHNRSFCETPMSELKSHESEIESCIGGIRYATIRKFIAIDEYNNGLIDQNVYRQRLALAEQQLRQCIELIIGFIQF